MNGAQPGIEKPAGCWTSEETIAYMIEEVFEKGEFYVLCPDNETPLVSSLGVYWNRNDATTQPTRLSITQESNGLLAISLKAVQPCLVGIPNVGI